MKATSILLIAVILVSLCGLVNTEVSQVTCKRSSKDRETCLECRNFYHLYENQCYVNILGCQSYAFGNICRKCARGFILVNNECCDRACMRRIYNEEQHKAMVSKNREEVLRKCEVEGLEKSITIITKNSIKSNEEYDIVNTRSQKFDKIFRYFVDLNIRGKPYVAICDYDIVSGSSEFVSISVKGEESSQEIQISQENIHSTPVLEEAYSFISKEMGLELYGTDFKSMTLKKYGRSNEIKCIFIGNKALVVTVMVSEQHKPYVLWKEEKTNVEEVKVYLENRKQVETIKNEYNFKQVYQEALVSQNFNTNEVEIMEIQPISQTEYEFIIYNKVKKFRYRVKGAYSTQTKTVKIEKIEEIFSEKLQEIKKPEEPVVRVITKESISKNVETKEVFDYLYKVQPSFRQTQVESVKIEESEDIKKIFVISKKDNKEFRQVLLKEKSKKEMQLIDQGFVTSEKSTATIVKVNSDNTKTITTNKIDYSKTEVKTVVETLKKNHVNTKQTKIESLQTTEGPNSVEYVVVLADVHGHATKQITITEDKTTKETTVIDYTTLEPEVKYIKPVEPEVTIMPVNDYYKPEVKELITKVEAKAVDVVISKVNKIEVSETSSAKKYSFVVENTQGKQVKIDAVQINGESSVDVIKVRPYVSTEDKVVSKEVKTVKKVNEFGVKVEFTNDRAVIKNTQTVKIAVAEIVNVRPELKDYQVVSVQTKDYIKNEEQILIMTNGQKSVQVVGTIDQRTKKYTIVEEKEVSVDVTYPVITQNTIPVKIYPIIVKKHKELRDCEHVLVSKFRIFKNKVPISTTVEHFDNSEVVNYNYQVGKKNFLAVVRYDKKEHACKIVEVSPIVITKPIKFDQVVVQDKVVTTSSSVQEIKTVNKKVTEKVIEKVIQEYPLIENYEVSEITLTESDFNNVVEITYQNEETQEETTVTVRTDKEATTVTIDNVESTDESITEVVKIVQLPKVVLTETQFEEKEVKKVINVVSETKVKVDKVKKIVTETAPNYVTYTMEIVSNNEPFEVTVIDNKVTQNVVAVRSIKETKKVKKTKIVVKPTTVKEVNVYGNKIVKTNDVKYIKTIKEVSKAVEQIKIEKKEFSSYTVDSVQTVDYGTNEAITVTLIGTKPSEAVTSTVFYSKETQKVKVVSVEKVTKTSKTTKEQKKEVFFGKVVPTCYPVSTVPAIAIPNAIETDEIFKLIVQTVQESESIWSSVMPSTTEVQKLTETVIQYTVMMVSSTTKKQIVVMYYSDSQTTEIVSVDVFQPETKPIYVTETIVQGGIKVESNSVEEIKTTHKEVTKVMEYSNKWLHIKDFEKEVQHVQVIPSTVQGGNIIYTIETKDETQTQKIEVSFNSQTQEMTVVNLQVEPVEQVIFAPEKPVVVIDVESNTEEVNKYVELIKTSETVKKVDVKKVVKVEKEQHTFYEKVYTEVINEKGETQLVTIIVKEGEKPVICDIQGGEEPTGEVPEPETCEQVETTDENGNQVVEITGEKLIIKKVETRRSVMKVVRENKELKDFKVVKAQTIDYGTVKEVNLVFKQKETKELVQSTVIFNTENQQVDVISIQPVELPEVSEPEEEPEEPSGQTGEEGVEEEPEPEIAICVKPTTIIPQVLVSEVIKNDKVLKKVVHTVQKTEKTFHKVVPISVKIEKIDEAVSKYVSVMEVKGERKEVVNFYNKETEEVKTVSVKKIEKEVVQTYAKETITSTGETQYSSNNLVEMTKKFTDLKVVLEEVKKTVTEIDMTAVNVAVIPRDSVNSYTIQTVKDNKQVTVQLNYDIKQKKPYVTNCQIEPKPVICPAPPVYYPEPMKPEIRYNYYEVVKNCNFQEIEEVINVVSSTSTSHPLYKEIILEVEAPNNNYFVKLTLNNGETSHTCISATPVETQPDEEEGEETGETGGEVGGQLPGEEVPDQTCITTDTNGNTVTVSTDQTEIEKNEAVITSRTEIIKKQSKYSEHKIKYTKTVNFGLVDEVVMTMVNPVTHLVDTKAIAFFNKETKDSKIVSIMPVEQPTPERPVCIKPLYPAVLVPDSSISTTIKKDVGLRTVLKTIQKSSTHYRQAVPVSVEVQTLGDKTNKYVVVLEVNGKKEQKVYTYQKDTEEAVHFATTNVAKQVVSKRVVQTVVDNKKVTVSNSVTEIQEIIPETKPVIAICQQEDDLNIESVSVVDQTDSKEVTVIAKSKTTKEVVIKKFSSKEEKVVKVDQQVVQISEIARPRPIIYIPINPVVITENKILEQQVKKVLKIQSTQKIDTKKITSISVSKNTNVQVYDIVAIDQTGKEIMTEIVFNPSTEECEVIDVSEVKETQSVSTTTQVKEVSGVSQVTTTNVQTIKETKEFKQISEFLIKNHPEEHFETVEPIVERTEKYQRSVVKTVVFRKETKTIQSTYVLDQRTHGIVEIDYQVLPYAPEVVIELPFMPKEETYSTVSEIKKITTSSAMVIKTINTINNVDSTLENTLATFINIEEYRDSYVLTFVYDTPRSNSRILIIFNKKTQETRVVDYTKIAKEIKGSKVVEVVNKFGHISIYTDKIESIKKTKEITTVLNTAGEIVSVIKGKAISGIETTVKGSATEYKIVTIDNGIVNQVVLSYNKETEKVTFVSKSETSVANEVMKVVKKTKKVTKLDVKTIQETITKDIAVTVVEQHPDIFQETIVESGTVEETEQVQVYTLKMKTKTKQVKKVKIIKDKKTKEVIVQDIQPCVVRPVPRPTVITQSTTYGNIEKTVTSKKVIKESKEIQTVVKQVYQEKPELAILPVVSVQTVTYGNIEENTVVLAKERKTTVQVTSITDKIKKTTRVVATKMLPVITRPWVPVKPVVPIRVIPSTLVEIMKKTSTEIREITKKVETVNVKVEEISVVDLGQVKKYTTIVTKETGKEQTVFIVDKTTKKIEKIQTVQIKKDIKKVFHKQVINKFGQTVTTSSSTTEVIKVVPEVTTVVDLIKENYQVDVSSSTEVIEVKGTTVKQVKIVSIDKVTKEETVFTSIIDGTDVQIVDVQVKPAVLIRPMPIVKPVFVSQVTQEVTVEVEKEVEKVIKTNHIIKTEFKESDIKEIKTSSTELVTSYQVTVVNENQETAVVELIQQIGQPLTIVNVESETTQTSQIVKETKQVKTEMTVESTTGNQVFVTNDQHVITTNTAITSVTQYILSHRPEFVTWAVTDVTTVTYGTDGVTKKTTVIFTSSTQVIKQVTTIVNTETNDIQIINVQIIRPNTKPHVQVIPKGIVKIASRKYKEISNIVKSIESTVSSKVTVESIQVEELDDVKIYTPIISTSATSQKTEFVYVFNKKTKEVKEIEHVKIEKVVKQKYFEKETTKFNEIIIKSNDVVLIAEEKPEINVVLTKIDETYTEKLSETIKSVKVVEQKFSTEFQIVAEVQGKITEVTVIKKDDKIEILGLEEIVQVVRPLPVVEVEEEEKEEETTETTVTITSETGSMISEVINTSEIKEIQTTNIVSIKEKETILNTVYTVETKDESNNVQVVTISVEPDQKPVIVQVEEVKSETTQSESISTVVTQETKVTKEVSEVTGEIVTVQTGEVQNIPQIKICRPIVERDVPLVDKSCKPATIKTTQNGQVTWNTIIYPCQEKKVQVTCLVNSVKDEITIVDFKELVKPAKPTGCWEPEVLSYHIPKVAIKTTARRMKELKEVMTKVESTHKHSEIDSIEIENFGKVQKISAVVVEKNKKIDMTFLVNKETKEVTLIQETVIPEVIQEEFYKEETNKYGETTIVTNNVKQVTEKITTVKSGIKYIEEKYPVIVDKQVEVVEVVEYPESYKINYVSQVDTTDSLAIVVEVNKETEEVIEISTYTKDDVEEVFIAPKPEVLVKPAVQEVSTESKEVTKIVEYLETSEQVSTKKIEKVIKVEKETTVFGTEVVTIVAITSNNEEIKTEVIVNPETEEIQITEYEVVQQVVSETEVITEFKVDVITGTKVTVTNNPTVIASSQIMQTISEEVKSVQSNLVETVMISSTTTEYPDKIKVVSLFRDDTKKETTQVVSIVDKKTSKVEIVETQKVSSTKTVASTKREVFTSSELISAEKTYPCIHTTQVFIQEQFPEITNEKPSTTVCEPMEESDMISYIYQSGDVKTQVVTMCNHVTHVVTLVESNPISVEVKPFYYEEKTTEEGNVVVTNKITEVVERIPETTILTEFIKQNTQITEEQIETVELTSDKEFIDYKIVTKEEEGVKQYEYIVNTETKEVKEVNQQVISEDIPIVIPKQPEIAICEVGDKEVKEVLVKVIEEQKTELQKIEEVKSVVKEQVTKGTKYEVEFITPSQEVKKVVIMQNVSKIPVVIDERPIIVDFKPQEPVVIKDIVDKTTKVKTIVYPDVKTFELDESSEEITSFVKKTIVESKEYEIQAIRKESFGTVEEYDILMKSDKKAPIQITVAKDVTSKNVMILEKKVITEEEEKSVIEGPADKPVIVEVSEVEKENIKVLSKLGLVKDIKEYKEVKVEEISHKEQFVQAIEDVKHSYSSILSNAPIIKTYIKEDMEKTELKAFYQSNEQIYEASIEVNEITGQNKLTQFIKVGTQSYTKSEVNVYSDLCYGYQNIEDFSMDGNLDFITTYLKQKYESLKDVSLIEAQQIILNNGRINYKLYFKREGVTVKYIVYYEPEYKRVLQIRGSSFNIGSEYVSVPKTKQVSDPYFRKLDSYIRQNREKLSDASIMHTESKDNGQNIEFRTVYEKGGKSFRSIASINKDTQNVKESTLSEIIEIPVEEARAKESECNADMTKLTLNDLGTNSFFSASYTYVKEKYDGQLKSAQFLGASEKTNVNIYSFVFYFIVEQTKIVTVSIDYNPIDQSITVVAEPSTINIQDGYYPVRSDKKLTKVRNWLKENNPDLTRSVLISSNAKKFYFGTMYKIVFKVSTRYIIYIAYVECGKNDVKIYDTQEVAHYSSTPETNEGQGEVHILPYNEGEGQGFGGDAGQVVQGEGQFEEGGFGGDAGQVIQGEGQYEQGGFGGDAGQVVQGEDTTKPQLKGFARPHSAKPN